MKKSILFFLVFFINVCVASELDEFSQYLLPATHPLKSTLDLIFADPSILESQNSLDASGFITMCTQPSGMRVLKHPQLKGYLIKAYLNSDESKANNLQWPVDRCKGAEDIRSLIKEKKLKYFSVPDKWIYILANQRSVLLVTDMNLVSKEESKKAWKNKVTHKHLRELYCILSHGFASCYLPYNIPYTNDNTFACVDTAYPPRKHNYNRVKSFLSEEMKLYWDTLIKAEKKSPSLDLSVKRKIAKYQLPENHNLRKTLSSLINAKTLKNRKNLELAGFTIVHERKGGIYVVSHPKMSGFLLKLYLNTSQMKNEEVLRRLTDRCEGAENIRNLIEERKMQHFTVPEKWIFSLPDNNAVLVVTNMNIVSTTETKDAWKNIVTHEHIDELFSIISAGYASSHLPRNIPYTRNGKFTCLDTEQPKRTPNYIIIGAYLSPEMAIYWDKLVANSS